MSRLTKVEVAVMLILGICLIVLLPTVELLPASTRAWRRARVLLASVCRLILAAKPALPALTSWCATYLKRTSIQQEAIRSLNRPLLC